MTLNKNFLRMSYYGYRRQSRGAEYRITEIALEMMETLQTSLLKKV